MLLNTIEKSKIHNYPQFHIGREYRPYTKQGSHRQNRFLVSVQKSAKNGNQR